MSDNSHLGMAAMSAALREPGGEGSVLPQAPSAAATNGAGAALDSHENPIAAVPEAIAKPIPDNGGFIRDLRHDWRKVSPVNKVLAISTILGLILAAIATFAPFLASDEAKTREITEAEAPGTTPEQRKGIQSAFEDVRREQSAIPTGLPSIEQAEAMLRAGYPDAARELFKALREQKDREAKAATKERARATRNLAAITVLTDKAEALSLYREATTLDPSDMEAWIGLGDAAMLAGTKPEAERAFAQLHGLAERTPDERDDSVAWDRLGDVREAQGDLGGALSAYEAMLVISEKLATGDASNSDWQRDRWVSHTKIGDVRVAQGDLGGALAAYEAGLAILEKLASRHASNSEWQRDLSVSLEKIGNVRAAQGDLAGALRAYEEDLAIARKLASADPTNSEWQRDLSVSHDRIGDVRRAQGDLAGALRAYEDGLAIREKLASGDPSNSEWQRDLSVSHERIGDVLVAQGDLAGALQAYEKSHAIARKLTSGDPANSLWQRDLSVSHDRIGDVRRAQGDLAGALRAYGEGLAIRERLASGDPSNSGWQRDLSVSHDRIGNVRVAQGDLAGALRAYEDGLAIAQKLASGDPSNSEWQRDLIVSLVKLAQAGGDAAKHYGEALAIANRLKAEGRLRPVDAFIPGMLEERLAAARGG